jgi:hypothetical protein
MTHAFPFRRHRLRAASSGFVTAIPLALAAVAAIMLMSACHSTPALVADTQAAQAEPATQFVENPDTCDRACTERAMAHLQPFDEHFYTPPLDADDAPQD